MLLAARTLLDNGEDTSGVLNMVARVSEAMHLDVVATPDWGEVVLRSEDRVVGVAPTVPWNVNMQRVVATLEATSEIATGRLRGEPAAAALESAARRKASGLLPFALACAIGAPALSILNGASSNTVLVVVGCTALAGALLRRALAAWKANGLAQLLAAAFIAGLIGAVAAREHVTFDTGLLALGPLFVLVPGPALLGGAFDLVGLRIPLGLARLTYGVLSIIALSAGVVIGVAIGGPNAVSELLPVSPTALWLDMICAAIASTAYGIFFTMPKKTLIFPATMGAVAHGLRWGCLNELHFANAYAAGLACLLVGVVMEPLSRRLNLPFAALGFASVVSQVPGVYLFRMSAGLAKLEQHGAHTSVELLAGILSDGGTATLTLVTMALGLVIPKSVYMRIAAP